MKKLLFFLFLSVVSIGVSQQTDYVDFISIKADLHFDTSENRVIGNYVLHFNVLKSTDSIFIDAQNMTFSKVKLGSDAVNFRNDKKRLWIEHKFLANKSYYIKFKYEATPKKAMYFIDYEYEDGNKQIWTQGQGKYTSNWLPSFDDMNEKTIFHLDIIFDKNYNVIANGKRIKKQVVDKETASWSYNMQKPMSSYLVALAIGKYNKKVAYSKSGIPLEMYYYPEDALKFEPTYRYTKQIFDFLEEEIGVPYPWQNYKQVPVKDFLYAGMENTSITIFSDAFVVDSIGFADKNYVNVNAHELAHQWFGDLVTETSGTHHWLQEGFATYYALLAERDVFGDDYYYSRLYEYAQELLEQDKQGGSTSLLDSKSSSTTFYKRGAWVLHVLREKVGDESFKKGVKNYLKAYQFKNVETNNFISEIEKASGKNLTTFVKSFLLDSDVEYLEDLSEKMKYTKLYSKLGIKNLVDLRKVDNEVKLEKLSSLVSSKIKESLFNDLIQDSLFDKRKLYKKAFNSEDIKVRQMVSQSLSTIPLELKLEYESLLEDKSYLTIEVALFTLWQNFPEERKKYLNKTKRIIGFSDKNVELLWLTLALITDDFEVGNKKQYFDKLTDYTSPKYGFEVRQNAFQYLTQIQACKDVCQDYLKAATKHHNWRFSKMAKTLLKGQ